MVHAAGDPGFIAWANGVDTSIAGKLDTSTAASTYETQSHASSTYESAAHALASYVPFGQNFASVKDPAYGAKGDGTTDDTAAIQAALNASGYVLIPPGVYKVTSTLSVPNSGRTVHIAGGATVRAATGLTGPVFDTSISAIRRDVLFTGGGIIDCNEIATQGIWLRYYINCRINNLRIDSAVSHGIKLGDTAAAGRSAEAQISNVHIYRPSTNAIPAASYGIYEENSGDAQVTNVVVQSYQYGIFTTSGSGSFFTNCHAWADPASGTMHTAFYDNGSCTWTNCYADTPGTYGFRAGTFNSTFIGCKVYNATYGSDNVIEAIHFDQASPTAAIIACEFIGTSGHRIAKDVGGATFPNATLTAIGNKNTNVVLNFTTTERMTFLALNSWVQPSGGAHIYSGSGAPTLSGTSGDIFFRTDTPTTANQRIYINTGTTTWVGIL